MHKVEERQKSSVPMDMSSVIVNFWTTNSVTMNSFTMGNGTWQIFPLFIIFLYVALVSAQEILS